MPIVLRITPGGVYREDVKIGFDWHEACRQMLAWSEDQQILLEPFDSFTQTSSPVAFRLVQKAVDDAGERIRWTFYPAE